MSLDVREPDPLAAVTPLLLFDLGGVLVENHTITRLRALLDRPPGDDTLNLRWSMSPAVLGFEHGQLSPGEFAMRFLAEWNLQLEPGAFLEEFSGWPARYYPGAERVLQKLAGRYRLACLSNSNELHWARYNGFREFFHPALSSHLLGVMKPEPLAFRLAVERCGVPAADILFFDDLPANVAAARAEGMRAFQVQGFKELELVLLAEGLLTGTPHFDRKWGWIDKSALEAGSGTLAFPARGLRHTAPACLPCVPLQTHQTIQGVVMLNRAAMIVRPSQLFIDWVINLGDSGLLPDKDGEQTVYLVPEYSTDEDTEEILKEIYEDIFESELNVWSQDEKQWPKKRDLAVFNQWFSVEFHSVIEDLCDYELRDEEPEDDEDDEDGDKA